MMGLFLGKGIGRLKYGLFMHENRILVNVRMIKRPALQEKS
jgi:hypothetical protein